MLLVEAKQIRAAVIVSSSISVISMKWRTRIRLVSQETLLQENMQIQCHWLKTWINQSSHFI